MIGVRHCIATSSGTTALAIAARAADLKGEVIVPSLTYVATPHALQWQQITPVFCDVDPATHNLDPRSVEALITPRTTGIIGVHLWGRACAIDQLTELAGRFRLRLLFDAAHAFACSAGGRLIGNFGDAETFSFHATKFLSTFEGGAVVTNDDELAHRVRLMTGLGFIDDDRVVSLGINGKMNEVASAMGVTSLESLEEFIAANRQNYHCYRSEFLGTRGLTLLAFDEAEKSNYQYIVVEIDREVAGISRDDLLKILRAENILARRYFFPGCHRVEPYVSSFEASRRSLPETDKVVERVLILPTGPEVSEEMIKGICRLVDFCLTKAEEILARLEPASEVEGEAKR
jgi:dTDP-4-amino-4,6-dideoxygalactose transaminase